MTRHKGLGIRILKWLAFNVSAFVVAFLIVVYGYYGLRAWFGH